ncbi:MAG: hypothetical protein GX447_07325 [Elusimicrobia bacterium]|nr:hypothetical protein [Elusimicrobiota bacterium]
MRTLIINIIGAFVFLSPVFASSQIEFEKELVYAQSSFSSANAMSFSEINSELEKTANPVIITVAGLNFGEIGWGPFEFKNFKKLIALFFPKKSLENPDFEEEFYKEYGEYFAQEVPEPSRLSVRLPDNYLEQKIKELPYYNPEMVIIPFAWSREPADTDKTVAEFERKLKEVYKTYGGKKPIFIIAHSWGSVLMHETLHRLEKSAPDVKIDKLITMGSPLVPSNFVVKLFMKIEISKEDLIKKVTHPQNLRYWKNIWAERDMYSNKIPAADYNIQVDEKVERLEPTLLDIILHNKELRPVAKTDFLTLRDIKAWHGSYMFDYRAYLKSVNKEISLEIFKPVVAPQLLEYDKKDK